MGHEAREDRLHDADDDGLRPMPGMEAFRGGAMDSTRIVAHPVRVEATEVDRFGRRMLPRVW